MSVVDFEKIVAFIPSAGLGTRLKPLTNTVPKALVNFMECTMLEGVLKRLNNAGITKFIVNVHHFPKKMMDTIGQLSSRYDIRVSDESTCLLDTGGGVMKALEILTESEQTLLVHNVDVYAGFNLQDMIRLHFKNNNDVTFAVSNRETSRKLIFIHNQLCGWTNKKTTEFIGQTKGISRAFSGIHLVHKSVFANVSDNVFPLIPYYLSVMRQVKTGAFEHSFTHWFDLGTRERIKKAESVLVKIRN